MNPSTSRLAALATLVISLVACGGDAPRETAPEGQVSQYESYRHYEVQPPLDLVLVVSTSTARGGAALRASVTAAVRERMRELAEGESWLRDVWNPIEVRAFVVQAASGSLRSSATDPALSWREANATAAGADAFATAVGSAIESMPDGEAPPGGVIEMLRRTLAATETAPRARRLVLVASTADEVGVTAARDPALRLDLDSLIVAVPSEAGAACRAAPVPTLERWGKANDAVVQTPCDGVRLRTSFVDYAASCLPRALRHGPPGDNACRVRAFVPKGTPCDASRGWRASAIASAPTSDPELARLDACEVVPLEGDDAAACRANAKSLSDTPSGWCIPAPSRACAAEPPRVVGGAAPPFAYLEIRCELGP